MWIAREGAIFNDRRLAERLHMLRAVQRLLNPRVGEQAQGVQVSVQKVSVNDSRATRLQSGSASGACPTTAAPARGYMASPAAGYTPTPCPKLTPAHAPGIGCLLGRR